MIEWLGPIFTLLPWNELHGLTLTPHCTSCVRVPAKSEAHSLLQDHRVDNNVRIAASDTIPTVQSKCILLWRIWTDGTLKGDGPESQITTLLGRFRKYRKPNPRPSWIGCPQVDCRLLGSTYHSRQIRPFPRTTLQIQETVSFEIPKNKTWDCNSSVSLALPSCVPETKRRWRSPSDRDTTRDHCIHI